MNDHLLAICLLLSLLSCSEPEPGLPEMLSSRHNVIWDSPSPNQEGSMPLGNGDIAANVWMTPDGMLHFYLAKTDAVNENAQLLKLGKVELSFSPNPFTQGGSFEQELLLEDGSIRIRQTDAQGQTLAEILVWIDAHHPAVQVSAETASPTDLQVTLVNWRDTLRVMGEKERHAAYGVSQRKGPVYVYPDTIFPLPQAQLAWAHHNQRSIWELTFDKQNLGHLKDKYQDPLLYRTFGGLIEGKNLEKQSDKILASNAPQKQHQVQVVIYSAQEKKLDQWVKSLQTQAGEIQALSLEKRYFAHRQWWRNFWNRSYILPSGSAAIDSVARGYTLQRFISACAGRGVLPIKFNGSLFTTAGVDERRDFSHNADYRMWGGPYWFQNTRLIYWPMLESGDFEMMQPLFRMYLNNLPYAKDRVQHYFGHEGAMYPETQYFWGAYAQDNYGWEEVRAAKGITDQIGITQNTYIRLHYEGALELLAIMLDYYKFTEREGFLQDTLLPLGNEMLRFYEQHYPRDEKGQIFFYPAQAIETFWNVENPTPVVSGLRWNLSQLLKLPESLTGSKNRQFWQAFLEILPPTPRGTDAQGADILLPAADLLDSERKNFENPELYAVYPFREYGIGKPELDMAIRSFKQRYIKGNRGWFQDETQAAYLGLAGDASTMLQKRASQKHPDSRFPAFWGPNFDWVPDQDHGGNLLKALQVMLIQHQGDSLLLFPAWPKDWDVEFKLHAPKNTVVQGKLVQGQVESLSVSPANREKDLINFLK